MFRHARKKSLSDFAFVIFVVLLHDFCIGLLIRGSRLRAIRGDWRPQFESPVLEPAAVLTET
jgi:hypothetical protein